MVWYGVNLTAGVLGVPARGRCHSLVENITRCACAVLSPFSPCCLVSAPLLIVRPIALHVVQCYTHYSLDRLDRRMQLLEEAGLETVRAKAAQLRYARVCLL